MTATGAEGDVEAMVAGWLADPERAGRIVHVERLPARDAVFLGLDPLPPDGVRRALESAGVARLYRHQARAIANVRHGTHTVVAAGTASGKSLAYQVPIAENVAGAGATALALYPTKALARDQLRSLDALAFPGVVADVYDGDTPREHRPWVRRHANTVLTNPDMLHLALLPNHERWARFLGRLRLVVVDELHVLRGIFGSNVAFVLRRLRRLAAHYGAEPTFLFTSATIGNPGELAERLGGLEVEVIDDDASPAGERLFLLWNPPLDADDDSRRRSALSEATDAYVDLIRHGHHTIAFTRSRRATELIHRWASARLDDEQAARIAPYRAGYLPADRRRIEQALFSGDLLGVSATTALELGIDVGNLDAAVITTFPGTLASLRQQAGRAGRTRRRSMAVLVAGQDALDQYYMTHPAELFSRPAEAAVVNPDNPGILADHMGCAAYELPLQPSDREFLGEAVEEAAPDLVASGDLAVRDGKLYWARRRPPAPDVDVRSTGGAPYTITDHEARLLGTIDAARVFGQAHPGAVYLHQGDTYVVTNLDTELREVRVRGDDPGYYTQAKEDKDLRVLASTEQVEVGALTVTLGPVEVESQVVAYQRKAIGSGDVLDTVPLDLPPQLLRTESFWVTVPEGMLTAAGIDWHQVPGTLHAAEHTAIAMLPLFAICDRWDVGGLSTARHPDTGGPVWFIYEGYDGGAGISPIGFAAAGRHLAATRDALASCPCRHGCPSCVVSPKCGNFNEPLSKDGALRLLAAALQDL